MGGRVTGPSGPFKRSALAGRSVQSPPRGGPTAGRPLVPGVRQILDDGFLRGFGGGIGLIDHDVALTEVAQHLPPRPHGEDEIHVAPGGHRDHDDSHQRQAGGIAHLSDQVRDGHDVHQQGDEAAGRLDAREVGTKLPALVVRQGPLVQSKRAVVGLDRLDILRRQPRLLGGSRRPDSANDDPLQLRMAVDRPDEPRLLEDFQHDLGVLADRATETVELPRLGHEITGGALANQDLRIAVLARQEGCALEVVVRDHDAKRNAEKNSEHDQDQERSRDERRARRGRDRENRGTGDQNDRHGQEPGGSLEEARPPARSDSPEFRDPQGTRSSDAQPGTPVVRGVKQGGPRSALPLVNPKCRAWPNWARRPRMVPASYPTGCWAPRGGPLISSSEFANASSSASGLSRSMTSP